MRIQASAITALVLSASAPAFASILYPATNDNLFLTGNLNGSPTVEGPTVVNAGMSSPTAVADLQMTASGIFSLPANGTASFNSDTLTLDGHYSATNMFYIQASQLSQANAINIDIPAGSDAIVTVLGYGAITLPDVPLNYDPAHTLWNLGLFSAINNTSFAGSVIAPYADVTFNSGTFMGTLIAKSLSGSGEFKSYPFIGDLNVPGGGGKKQNVLVSGATPSVAIPEPASLATLAVGSLALLKRRKK